MRTLKKFSPILFVLALVLVGAGAVALSNLQDPEAKVLSQPKMLSVLKMEEYRPPEQIASPAVAFRKARQNSSGVLAIYRAEDEHGPWYDKVLRNPGIGSYLHIISYLRVDPTHPETKSFMMRYGLAEKSTILLLDPDGKVLLRLEGTRDLTELGYQLQQMMVTQTNNQI